MNEYQQPVDEVLTALHTTRTGLTEQEAQTQLKDNGPNELAAEKPVPGWRKVLAQFQNVLVVDGVVDEAPGTARTHEPHAAKEPQLMRHGRLTDPDKRCDVADAQFARRQRVEDSNACRITQNTERIGQRLHSSRTHQRGFALVGKVRRITLRREVDSCGN